MVEMRNQLVFLLYKLCVDLNITGVNRIGSEGVLVMKIIKSKLHNKLKNDWFNDLMICYTERKIFRQLDDGVIAQRVSNHEEEEKTFTS
jgi:hypothetical protein